MKILLDFQKGMRAVTLNSEFSLCGLMAIIAKPACPHPILGGGGGGGGGEALTRNRITTWSGLA